MWKHSIFKRNGGIYINNEKLKKIEAETAKIKAKISDYTARLRELERQKTETMNAGIIALVRDMDILPDELSAFIQAFKKQSGGGAAVMPDAPELPPAEDEPLKNDKEDSE